MYLVSLYKINELTQQREDYNYKIAQISREIDDLRSYAENIADSSNLFNSLFTAPASMYGRQLAYANYSSMFAESQANQQMSLLAQNPLYIEEMRRYENNPEAFAYRNAAIKKYYMEQAKDVLAKQESRLLHEKEKKLLNRKKSMEDRLESIKAQLSNYEKQSQEGAQNIFGGGGQRG